MLLIPTVSVFVASRVPAANVTGCFGIVKVNVYLIVDASPFELVSMI